MHICRKDLSLIKPFHPILECIAIAMQHLAQRCLHLFCLSAMVLEADSGEMAAIEQTVHGDVADAARAIGTGIRIVIKKA